MINANINIISGRGHSTSPSYDSAYQAILDRATALSYTPTTTYLTKGNDMITYLKAQNQWTKMKFLLVLKCDVQNFTRIDWVVPSRVPLTLVSSPTFTANQGWSSGASGDLTGLAANTYYGAGVRNVTYGCVYRHETGLPVGRYPTGFGGPIAGFSVDNTGADTSFGMFSFSGTTDSISQTLANNTNYNLGFVRTDASNVVPWVDGVAKTNVAKASVATDGTLAICSRNGTGFYNGYVRIVYGADNTVDMAVLHTAFTNYLA